MFIYALHDPDTYEIRYIGQTICKKPEKRFQQHICAAKKGSRAYSGRWINSLLKRDKRPIFNILSAAKDRVELNNLETQLIKTLKENGIRLTNANDGGQFTGKKGWKHTDEAKKKIAAAVRGRDVSEETRERMSKSRIGIQYSEETKKRIGEAGIGRVHSKETIEKRVAATKITMQDPDVKKKNSEARMGHAVSNKTRAKISEANKGRVLSQESKEKISKSLTGRPGATLGRKVKEETKEKIRMANLGKKQSAETKAKNSTKIIDQNGVVYSSMKSAGEILGISPTFISAHIKGKRKQCKGYIFKTYEVGE